MLARLGRADLLGSFALSQDQMNTDGTMENLLKTRNDFVGKLAEQFQVTFIAPS